MSPELKEYVALRAEISALWRDRQAKSLRGEGWIAFRDMLEPKRERMYKLFRKLNGTRRTVAAGASSKQLPHEFLQTVWAFSV